MRREGGKKRRRGAAVVELAIVLPVLFAILFGIIEFGWLFTAQHTMVNAAREAARLGVLNGVEATEIRARAEELLEPMGLNQHSTIPIKEATVEDPFVVVRITAPRDEVSLVGDFFGFSGGTLEGNATMRKEGM